MKVTLVHQISGMRNGEPWPAPGEVVDLPDDEAQTLIAGGAAAAGKQKDVTADDKSDKKGGK